MVLGQTSDEHYEKAADFYRKKDYDKALEYINKSLISKPTNGTYLLAEIIQINRYHPHIGYNSSQ